MGQFQPIKTKVLKKLSKREAYEAVLREMEDLVDYYFRNYTKQSVKDDIYERMCDVKHYARYIKHALKEENNPFPDGFCFILVDFLSKFGGEAMENDELATACEIYGKAIDKMSKTRAKKMAKDLDCPRDVAMEFAIIFPGKILSKHNAWIFNRALEYRLSQVQKRCTPIEAPKPAEPAKTTTTKKRTVAQESKEPVKPEAVSQIESVQKLTDFDCANPKFIKKLYKGFFGDDEEIVTRVYANMFLDKAVLREHMNDRQKDVWDAETQFLLNRVEKLPLKVVKNIIDMYTRRRSRDAGKDADQKRRVVFSELTYEQYPKLVTVLNPEEHSFKKALKEEKKASKKHKKHK